MSPDGCQDDYPSLIWTGGLTSQAVVESILCALPSFEEAARVTLRALHGLAGLPTWLITRKIGDEWTVVHAYDEAGAVPVGTRLPWSEMPCSHLVAGDGPRFAATVKAHRAYRSAVDGLPWPVGSYLGVPLTFADGTIFGTLCAFDGRPQPESVADRMPAIELAAQLLATVLALDLDADASARRREVETLTNAHCDPLTGLADARAFELFANCETVRQHKYGHDLAELVVDLDTASMTPSLVGSSGVEASVRRSASVLRSCVRAEDLAARLGPARFAILAAEVDDHVVLRLVARVDAAFAGANLPAVVSVRERRPRPVPTPPVATMASSALASARKARRTDRTQRTASASWWEAGA